MQKYLDIESKKIWRGSCCNLKRSMYFVAGATRNRMLERSAKSLQLPRLPTLYYLI